MDLLGYWEEADHLEEGYSEAVLPHLLLRLLLRHRKS